MPTLVRIKLVSASSNDLNKKKMKTEKGRGAKVGEAR